MTIPWLTILALLPVVGAVALITRAFALYIATTQFTIGGGMQLVEQAPWIKPLGVYYALGLDGVGLTLVLLVVIITPVVIIASWRDFEPVDGPKQVEESRSTGAETLAPK